MKSILYISTLLLAFNSIAQDKEKWDVSNPTGDVKWNEIDFTTDEGTWMNLDVSPDGKTIVFDMLGDIYKMPISGGKATVLRSGIPWEVQPRFSPNGDHILFTSDAGGADNCWIMDANGENAKQITKEDFRLLNNGVWTADGNYIVARKHFTSGRSLGAGEMWMYHKTGGAGIQLTKKKNDQQDVNEPSTSPDGKYLYYSEDDYPGGYFQYNKDPNSQIYTIKRYDFEKGDIKRILSGPGGAFRPEVSSDGKKLAFIKRIRTKTVLCVYDLESGQTFNLFDNLSKDQQEAWAIFGVHPGFDWMPDDKHIVIYGLGKIWKVNAKSGEATEIPFSVNVKTKMAETLTVKNDAHVDNFDAKVIRNAVTSPDGRSVVFNALGYLWQAKLSNGKAKRITKSTEFEFEPSFSKDGQTLTYVTWDDEKMGSIKQVNLNSKKVIDIISEPGIYRTPQLSQDGKFVVYRRDGGNSHQGFVHCNEPGIYTYNIKSGSKKLISAQGEYPVISQDGKRVFYQKGGYLFGSLTKSYESVDLNGQDKKEHFDGKHTQRYIISPDNKWVAWSELYKVYIAPFPKTGKKIGITSKTKAVPVAQVAKDAGINIHWSKNSNELHWTLGNEYFSDKLTERFKFLEGSVDSIPPMDSVGIKIIVPVETDKPKGMIAFTNAKVITMNGDLVIDNGTVVVENNIIKEVGSNVNVPNKAQVIDCKGKTLMPGIMDVHAHSGNSDMVCLLKSNGNIMLIWLME